MSAPPFYTPKPPGIRPPSTPPLVHSVTVDRAVIGFLQRWLPTYYTEAERREGKPTRWLARPAVYTTTYEEDDQDFFSDAKMPTVLVTVAEANDWDRDGDNFWMANFRTNVSVVMRGRSMPEARLQASLAIAAVTMLMLDKPSLDGFAGGVLPVAERPRPIEDPTNRSRSLAAGMGTYDIFVPYVRQGLNSPWPDEPPPDPDTVWPDAPLTEDVEVTFEGRTPANPLEDG